MILSGHQPCYLPSLQLFAKIAASDVFMHCGHLQFKKRSWHHRNYILLDGKRHLLSVPVHAAFGQQINQVWFEDNGWKKKHLETIALAYGKASFFENYYPTLKEIILAHPHSLELLNRELTWVIAGWLGIETKMYDSSNWHFTGDAVNKIVQMCKAVGAVCYLSNEGSQEYISPDEEIRMHAAGVWHQWLEFDDPDERPLSAVHHLFTLGPKVAELVRI